MDNRTQIIGPNHFLKSAPGVLLVECGDDEAVFC